MYNNAIQTIIMRTLRKSSILAGIFTLLMIFIFLISCGGATGGDRVILELVPSNIAKSDFEVTEFDVEGNFVLRCASFSNNDHEIVTETSKSKVMKANTLVFVKHIETASPQPGTQIAIAPITGKEYEYDMTQARFYTVTISSAKQAIEVYGIPYLDWQAGACNSSEQFPCCE